VGYPGGGGEYIVQEGFGWTNGVTLWILNKFGTNLTAPSQCLKINNHDHIFVKQNFTDKSQEEPEDVRNNGKRFAVLALDILFKIGFLFRLL
jgi:hypothetical protein